MRRNASAWLVAFPLMAAGTWLSHCYALSAVDPSTHAAAHHTGHAGRMTAAQFVFSAPFLYACIAVLALALVFRVGLSFAGHGAARMSALPFAVVPALGFFAHQHFEQLSSTGSISLAALTAPAFLLGLMLQIPFGIVAFFVVRFLLRFADRLGVTLAELRKARRAIPAIRRPRQSLAAHTPRLAALAHLAAPRAPPLAFQSR
jgi:hypothetical protein